MPVPDSDLKKNDGLIIPEVGPWVIDKHKKIAYYSSLFATSMKRRWDCRVYIDLFAGAGKVRKEGTKKILPGSPFLALNINFPFNKYIFCENDSEKLNALERRVKIYFPERDCEFILGDSNDRIEDILKAIPRYSRNFKVLTFCLIDPYKSADIRFDTIKQLAENIFIDFMMLIPTYMDINRNIYHYMKPDNSALDKYLGNVSWREKWLNVQRKDREFGIFIAVSLCEQMKRLGYLFESIYDLELVRMETGKNLPLYHLAFFSRNRLGMKFWRTTKKSTSDQQTLW